MSRGDCANGSTVTSPSDIPYRFSMLDWCSWDCNGKAAPLGSTLASSWLRLRHEKQDEEDSAALMVLLLKVFPFPSSLLCNGLSHFVVWLINADWESQLADFQRKPLHDQTCLLSSSFFFFSYKLFPDGSDVTSPELDQGQTMQQAQQIGSFCDGKLYKSSYRNSVVKLSS